MLSFMLKFCKNADCAKFSILLLTLVIYLASPMSNHLDASAAGDTNEENVSKILDEIHNTIMHGTVLDVEPQFAKLPKEFKSEKNLIRAAELHKQAAMSYYFEAPRQDRER